MIGHAPLTSLDDLIVSIFAIHEFHLKHHQTLPKSLVQLLRFTKIIQDDASRNNKNKFELLFYSLQEAFDEEIAKHSHSCFSYLFHNTLDSFINAINQNQHSHHYERMLALIIQATFAKYPGLRPQALNASIAKYTQAIKFPLTGSYHFFYSVLYENDQRFQGFDHALKNAGLQTDEVLALFTRKTPLTKSMITSLWPELHACQINANVIQALHTGIDDIERLEELMNSIDMHAIYAAKAEMAASGEQHVPLRKLENRRAFRDHLKTINIAIAVIRSRQNEMVSGSLPEKTLRIALP